MFNRSPFNQPTPPPKADDTDAVLTHGGWQTPPPPLPQDDPGAQPPPATLEPLPAMSMEQFEAMGGKLEPVAMVPDGYREVTPPLEAALAPVPSAEEADRQWTRDQLSKIIVRLDIATESKADLAESLRRHQAVVSQMISGGIAHVDYLTAGLVNLSNEDARHFAEQLADLRKAVAAFHLCIPLALPSEQQAAE